MKILLVNASPRKRTSRTLALAKHVLRGCAHEGAKCEIACLSDYAIRFCRHCELCHKKVMVCPIKDSAMMLARKILDADGIIYATPNYINQVTGALKTLFDRHSHFIHCKRLLGKYCAGVVTSGSGYDKPVARYLKYYSIICGAQFSGAVCSRADDVDGAAEGAFTLGRKLVSDIRKKRRYRGQLARIEKGFKYFGKLIKMHKNDWREEYLYWQDQGWLA
ncbi:MAG: flavodoxin family protein [Candidatus Omnitrophota bacterium]